MNIGAEDKQLTVVTDQEQENNYISMQKIGFSYGVYSFIKRLFDIVMSTLTIVVLALPVLAILLIKFLEDGHNPVYVSSRVGKDGRLFRFYKIRSMSPGADELKSEMINSGLNEADGPVFKIKEDPRVTPFGRFLRRTCIDEVLQFINVLKGDMSIVGPRPPLPSEVESYTSYQLHRLDVKGGLLCLWQIEPDRHSISFEQWVASDIEYIKNQSLWLDIKIIFKGAFTVLSGKSGD